MRLLKRAGCAKHQALGVPPAEGAKTPTIARTRNGLLDILLRHLLRPIVSHKIVAKVSICVCTSPDCGVAGLKSCAISAGDVEQRFHGGRNS